MWRKGDGSGAGDLRKNGTAGGRSESTLPMGGETAAQPQTWRIREIKVREEKHV